MFFAKKKIEDVSEIRDQRLMAAIERANQTLKYTPDVAALERKLRHLVFFCDGHMRGRFEHDKMEQFEYKGTCFTQRRYHHWMRKLGLKSYTIPIIAKDDAKSLDVGTANPILANPARIKGELFLIDTENLKQLDSFRENGVKYVRRRRAFLMPVRKRYFIKERDLLFDRLSEFKATSDIRYTEMHVVHAWIYEAVPSFWEDQLDGGYAYSPVRIFKPRRDVLGNYSFFTNLEYEHTPTYDSEPAKL